jgi:hypothetical protein
MLAPPDLPYPGIAPLQTEITGASNTTFTFDQAGNEQVVATPTVITTNSWDSENRLVGLALPPGGANTMAYRSDGLRHRLADSESDKVMVWDEHGSSGYIDLLEENQP